MELKREEYTAPAGQALYLDRWGEFELKAEGDKRGWIAGYASKWGEKDRGSDIVMPGAFKKSLKTRKSSRIPMLYGHLQSALPIGAWVIIKEDDIGLWVEGPLALGSEAGRQMYEVLSLKAEMGISIGYRTSVWEYDEKASVRRLIEVDLFEISLVPIPMLDSARVTSVKADAPQIPPAEAALIRALEGAANTLDITMALGRAARCFD